MKLIWPILIALIFIQTTFSSFGLSFSLILAKSYLRPQAIDYLLALITGILISLLTGSNLGLLAIIFIFIVFLTHVFRLAPISLNLIFFIISSTILLILTNFLLQIIAKESFSTTKVFLEEISTIIFYIIFKFTLINHKKSDQRLRL